MSPMALMAVGTQLVCTDEISVSGTTRYRTVCPFAVKGAAMTTSATTARRARIDQTTP